MSILGRKINEEIKTARTLRELKFAVPKEKSIKIMEKQLEIDEKVKFLQGLEKAIEERDE